MKPTFSIIFFTVSSGAGLGLLVLLALSDLWPEPLLPTLVIFGGVVFALVLVAAGLASSVLHLAKPANAWRAFSRVRTSWLSREAAFAVLLFPFAAAYAISLATAVSGASASALRAVLAVIAGVLAVAVLFCTSMIYASLKPIRQWHTRWTPTNYLLLGGWSGALWLLVLAAVYARSTMPFVVVALLFGVVSLAAKLAYWIQMAGGTTSLTLERALGVREGVRPPGTTIAQARLFDAGHSQRTFLTDEFVFKLARQHANALRAIALLLAFGIPLVCLAWMAMSGYAAWQLSLLLAVLNAAGLAVERWLFFAEARHAVRLYHGDART